MTTDMLIGAGIVAGSIAVGRFLVLAAQRGWFSIEWR